MFNSGWQEVLCCTRHVVKWAHRHDRSLRKREHCWEIISILIYFSSLSPFIICKPAGTFATKNCDHSRHFEPWQPLTESQDPSQAAFYSCTLQATVCSFYLVNCASCNLEICLHFRVSAWCWTLKKPECLCFHASVLLKQRSVMCGFSVISYLIVSVKNVQKVNELNPQCGANRHRNLW